MSDVMSHEGNASKNRMAIIQKMPMTNVEKSEALNTACENAK